MLMKGPTVWAAAMSWTSLRRTADAGICAHGGAQGSACWAPLNDSVRRPLGLEIITDEVWPAGYARREQCPARG
jgi:hypothetical protein